MRKLASTDSSKMKFSYFSSGLRRTLKEMGLTQEQFSKEINVTQSAIANLITRSTRIKSSTLKAIYTAIATRSREHADFLLIEHLRDEISRIGLDSTRFDVSLRTSDNPKLSAALKTLEQQASCSDEVRDLLVQMTTLFFTH